MLSVNFLYIKSIEIYFRPFQGFNLKIKSYIKSQKYNK